MEDIEACERRRIHVPTLRREGCPECKLKLRFKVTSSAKGGIDIDFGYRIIHVPNSSSVHLPLIQMVLFAGQLRGYRHCCSESIGITDMAKRQSSAVKPQRQSSEAVLNPVETSNRKNDPSLSGLFHKSTNNFTSSTISSTQRAAHDTLSLESGALVSVTEMKRSRIAAAADSEDVVLDSGGSMLATATSPQEHLSLNNLTDQRNDKPCSNRSPATNSSDETVHVPEAQKHTNEGSEHHSDPNSCVAESDTIEEAERSGEWYVATGTVHHVTWNRNLISNLEGLENDGICFHAADGTPMPVRGRGNVVTDNVVLPDVYYVPGLCTNLVSVGQLAQLGYNFGFSRGACVISSSAGAVVGRAHASGDGRYEVNFLRV